MNRIPRPDPTTLRTQICQVDGISTFSGVIQMPTTRVRAVDWKTAPKADWRSEILTLLGQGGMASVHLARDLMLGRKLAMKVLATSAFERFRREARLHAMLEHSAIPPLYDAGRLGDGRFFLAMKYVAGHSLADLTTGPPTDTVDLDTRLGWFEQVGHTIAYAHAKRVLHRDLKPENVMVSGYGRVYLIDWGLAKLHDTSPADDPGTGEHTTLGTLAYMAPEQTGGGFGRATEATDVFGLGALLFALLTGSPLYVGSAVEVLQQAKRCDPSGVVARLAAADTPLPLVGLVRRCLSVRPEDRPASAREVVNAAIRFRQSERVGADR